ncbi:hypothetical protein MMC29_000184 [Sticta canariensis]|nr:hypothetical protein [Sticta canariensis]
MLSPPPMNAIDGRPNQLSELQAMELLAAAYSPALQQAGQDLRTRRVLTSFPSLADIIADDSAQQGAASLWFWPHTRLAWVAEHRNELHSAMGNIKLGNRYLSPMHVLRAVIDSAHSAPLEPHWNHVARTRVLHAMDQLQQLRTRCDREYPFADRPGLQPRQTPSAAGVIMPASHTWDCLQYRVPAQLQQPPSAFCVNVWLRTGTPWLRDEQALRYSHLLADARADGIRAHRKAANSSRSAEDSVAIQLGHAPAELAAKLHLSCLAARFAGRETLLHPPVQLQHTHVSIFLNLWCTMRPIRVSTDKWKGTLRFCKHSFLTWLHRPAGETKGQLDILHSLTNGSLPEIIKSICRGQRIGLVMVDPPSSEHSCPDWSRMPVDGVARIFHACSRAFTAARTAESEESSSDVDEDDASAEQPGDWVFFSYLPRQCSWPPSDMDPRTYREIMLLPDAQGDVFARQERAVFAVVSSCPSRARAYFTPEAASIPALLHFDRAADTKAWSGKPYSEHVQEPTTDSAELMQSVNPQQRLVVTSSYFIRKLAPANTAVLSLFSGTGTDVVAALRAGHDAISVDRCATQADAMMTRLRTMHDKAKTERQKQSADGTQPANKRIRSVSLHGQQVVAAAPARTSSSQIGCEKDGNATLAADAEFVKGLDSPYISPS